jgi:hypothetical protein
MMVILVWQLFLWINTLIGNIFLLLFLISIFAVIFVRDWAVNDFYSSPTMKFWGNMMLDFIMFVTFLVGLFGAGNPIMPW